MSEDERIAIVKGTFSYALFELRISIRALFGISTDAIQREMDDYISEAIRD